MNFGKKKMTSSDQNSKRKKAGETKHTLLLTKENDENSEKNVTTRTNTSQPGEKQAQLPEQGLQCNQGYNMKAKQVKILLKQKSQILFGNSIIIIILANQEVHKDSGKSFL